MPITKSIRAQWGFRPKGARTFVRAVGVTAPLLIALAGLAWAPTSVALGAQGKGGGRALTSGQARVLEMDELRNTISSLKGFAPATPNLDGVIIDRLAAQQLGKALFWDVQVGSDGNACATCHFHGGADIRTRNMVDPDLKGGDTKFDARGSGKGLSGPNKQLTSADFPFHRLKNPSDRLSEVLFDTNDVMSSQGTFGGDFRPEVTAQAGGGSTPGSDVYGVLKSARVLTGGTVGGLAINRAKDFTGQFEGPLNENCKFTYDPANNPFHAGGLIHRKVEPRQTPTNINAVFNIRQFWDGRANSQFNGVDPFGPRTFEPKPDAKGPGNPNWRKVGTLVALPDKSDLTLQKLLFDNSSLASQAVGPALSDFEMSCSNKSFPDLARKILTQRPLALQRVDESDSLFGQGLTGRVRPLVPRGDRRGLNTTYQGLIERAFDPKFWRDKRKVVVTDTGAIVEDAQGFSQMEQNFSLFWGLAVQEYETLLISDDSPFDRQMNGDTNAMSDQARAGMNIFLSDKAGCSGCHFGPLLSGATYTKADLKSLKVIEHMPMSDGYNAFYDRGFYNIGVRPTSEDIGVGATDPYGFDLSYTRQLKWQMTGKTGKSADNFKPNPCKWVIQYYPCDALPSWTDPKSTERDTVDGSFKAPILRNVGLNPPYFHNGGQATLKDVVRFYNRGGDRRGPLNNDTSGLATPTPFGQINTTNLDPDIGEAVTDLPTQHNSRGLSEAEMDDIVQFLLSLSDDRVACHSGLFDHPELPLSMGHEEAAVASTRLAQDIVKVLPAVGKGGLKAAGKPCFPNSGDLFGSVNALDKTPLQATFNRILGEKFTDRDDASSAQGTGKTPLTAGGTAGGTTSGTAGSSGTGQIGGAGGTGKTTGTGTGTATGTGGTGGTTGGGGSTGSGKTTVTTAFIGTRGGTAKANLALALGQLAVPTTPPAVPTPTFTTALSDIHGFTTIGFLQNATLSEDGCKSLNLPRRQWGGTAQINNLTIAIPCNTVLQMPGSKWSWGDLFDASKFASNGAQALDIALRASGSTFGGGKLAFPSTEIQIDGNIVAGQHIAGLVTISQLAINSGLGYVTGFDYARGALLIGASPTGPASARVQLNDPKGRFSKGQSPDSRFSVDAANPTVRAVTGYPMCIPRSDPLTGADDLLCPQKNRPRVASTFGCRSLAAAGIQLPTGLKLAWPAPGTEFCSSFVMKAAPGTQGQPANFVATDSEPDVRSQAPFEVGDLVLYSGTLIEGDGQGPGGTDTVLAHTVVANLGIFTQPGTLPVYLAIADVRVSTFTPNPIFNGVPQEDQDRLVLEAFVTDVTSIVDIYLVDIDPVTGVETQRWATPGSMTGGAGALGSNGRLIDGGITTQFVGALPGRVRERANKAVTGILTSPTRYMRVVARSLCDPANVNSTAPLVGGAAGATAACLERAPAANGLFSGQYLAPNLNFILPENVVPGDPIVPNNFWDLGFLVNGEGPGTGPLTPKPW